MKSEIKVHNTSFIFTDVIDTYINGTLITDVTTNYMDVSNSINIPLVSLKISTTIYFYYSDHLKIKYSEACLNWTSLGPGFFSKQTDVWFI